MAESAWAQRPLPSPGPDAVQLRRWEPSTPRRPDCAPEAAGRRPARRRPPAGSRRGSRQRLLLVFEELVSNALRHGHAPVRAEVTTFDHFWLIGVTDAAADQPPTPAVGRDAAHGGLGLYLVARLCGAYGWTVADDRKHVWARIDYTRAEAPGWVPRPRRETDGHSSSV